MLQELLPQLSRTQIASIIMQGNVAVDGTVVTKPGTQIKQEAKIEYKFEEQKYVSRAGFKLEKALEHFAIDVNNLIVLDAGLSTGGFADCLLQHGASKIFGVDVGYGQVHEKIRKNPKVDVIERTNLREVNQLPEKVDLVTLDLSFISVLKVMPNIVNLMKEDGQLIVLIKPQFEAKREQVGRGGIIKDPKIHKEVIDKVVIGIKRFGFEAIGIIESPIMGTSGNKEFLGYFKRKN
jgi:23S rRNA (cytidine1920-2'-O)/16S rRNA (cytidine1409-2'-O)-methyltransferase